MVDSCAVSCNVRLPFECICTSLFFASLDQEKYELAVTVSTRTVKKMSVRQSTTINI